MQLVLWTRVFLGVEPHRTLHTSRPSHIAPFTKHDHCPHTRRCGRYTTMRNGQNWLGPLSEHLTVPSSRVAQPRERSFSSTTTIVERQVRALRSADRNGAGSCRTQLAHECRRVGSRGTERWRENVSDARGRIRVGAAPATVDWTSVCGRGCRVYEFVLRATVLCSATSIGTAS